jgi:choice-of-anchor B domain-containing protein
MKHLASCAALLALFLPSALVAQSFRNDNAPASLIIGFGTSTAIAGDQVLVGRPGLVPNFPMPPAQTGAVHIYRRGADGKYHETGSVVAKDLKIGDGFGSRIAVDGNLMAVSAPQALEGKGAVYIFERGTDGQWVERAKLDAGPPAEHDEFGSSLALGNGVLLVGVPGRAEGTGTVMVFRRERSAWKPAGSVTVDGLGKGDRFGTSLSLSGDRLLVGAPGPASNNPEQRRPGQAFVLKRSANGWTQEARLAHADSTIYGLGGTVLLAMGDALVSSPAAGHGAGVVLVFRPEAAGTWGKAAEIRTGGMDPALFGASLGIEGHDLLVGAPISNHGVGSVYIFKHDPASRQYSESQTLTTRGVGIGTQLGASLAVGNGLAVAGAPLADFFEGAGYLYRRGDGGQWQESGTVADTLGTGLGKVTGGEVRCETGKARGFDCGDADLVSFLPNSAIGAKRGIMLNDMWGWTDSASQREFALVGRLDGTSFIEVTNPANPVYLGDLPLHQGAQPNLWRDIKVYNDHAFIVSDGAGPHGVQVFDLRQLLTLRNAPVTFTETAHYDRIHSAHNIVINPSTGFAYTVGNSMGGETCGGALHMIDIRDPEHPTFAGCYADPTTGLQKTGYTHDAQCVIYHGPDEKYRGREICFNASETAVGVADVTDKQNPKPISTITYPNVAYAHQGWLTEDQKYFLLDDEGDELSGTAPTTRTVVFDVSDLDDPVVAKEFFGTTPATDHNLYVKGNYAYESNYVAGLRILDISDPTNPREVGFFDTVPYGENQAGFAGSWSNYPFFKSGVVGVTSMREGFFLVRYRPKAAIP